jgi:hypothetical protein
VTDTGNHTVRKILLSSGIVETIAGVAGIAANVNAIGTNARFNTPMGITGDGTSLYIADRFNHRIRKIELSTQSVTGLAGQPLQSDADGDTSVASFSHPTGVTLVGNVLYIADHFNSLIRQYSFADNLVATFAGNRPGGNGTNNAVSFKGPASITTDGTYLYLADSTDYTIRKIAINTGEVTTLAGNSARSGYREGLGSVVRFSGPTGITTDGANLYVTEPDNNSIRKVVIASGLVSTFAGRAAPGSDDAMGIDASFTNPQAITTDGTNLYIADTDNHTIRKIVIATAEVTTLAGTAGQPGSDNGMGAAARFYFPSGITTDGTYLYVTDTSNHTIRKIDIASRIVSTLAGTAKNSGNADGLGAKARFESCRNITSDGTYLYVTDEGNFTVRKVDKVTGEVTTIAGTSGIAGNLNGIGTAAKFDSAFGITNDGFNVYVTDYKNNTIRKIH